MTSLASIVQKSERFTHSHFGDIVSVTHLKKWTHSGNAVNGRWTIFQPCFWLFPLTPPFQHPSSARPSLILYPRRRDFSAARAMRQGGECRLQSDRQASTHTRFPSPPRRRRRGVALYPFILHTCIQGWKSGVNGVNVNVNVLHSLSETITLTFLSPKNVNDLC